MELEVPGADSVPETTITLATAETCSTDPVPLTAGAVFDVPVTVKVPAVLFAV